MAFVARRIATKSDKKNGDGRGWSYPRCPLESEFPTFFALFFPLFSHVATPSPRGDALPVGAFALFMGNGSSGSFSPLFAEDCHFETTNSFIWPFSHLNDEMN